MDTSGVNTLKDIVNTIMFNTGYGQSDYNYIYNHVIAAIREIHMFHGNKHKVVKINVNMNTFTIDWPDDYLGLVCLGIPINGKIWTLTRNDEIITTTTMINGQESLTSTQGEGVIIPKGQTCGYGATGGKNRYTYTSDENNRSIFINGANLQFANVILSYLSSGVEDENTLIPVKYYMPIEFFVRWRMCQRKDSGNLNDAQYWRSEYDKEISQLKAFEAPTFEEIYDAMYSVCSGTYQR
jgi:hypothetical protein